MGFKCIGDDGKFYIAAVLLNVTVENLKKNNKIAIAVTPEKLIVASPNADNSKFLEI